MGRSRFRFLPAETIEAKLPTYQMPQVRKHASGYFVAPGMDVIDLFIGSEGTLGVIVEAEVKLLPKPEGTAKRRHIFRQVKTICLPSFETRANDR